jgi:4-hydroxy-2-oxoheptanedioate aldolase
MGNQHAVRHERPLMQHPENSFLAALKADQPQIGFWLALASDHAAEAVAAVGFDWLLIDGEHGPNNLQTSLHQMRAIAPYKSHAVARLVNDDTALIKQYLDVGFQSLLIPMVDTAAQAARIVAAMHYPPTGIRGDGAAIARASRWNQIPNYMADAASQLCLLVQAETVTAMSNLDGIAATPGVTGVFFGPADLSASMGHPGNPDHPDVQAAIIDGIKRVRQAGKAAGIIATQPDKARTYLAAGARFVAVGVDTIALVQTAQKLCTEFKAR